MHPRIQETLNAADVTYRVRNHADFAKPIRSPQDFADCLGYELGRITKTLFCRSTQRDKYALVVAPMISKVNFGVLAEALSCARVEVASKSELESMLNYPPNGVSPLGVEGYPVFVDASLMHYPTILIGGGIVGVEIELEPAILVKLCCGQVKALGL